MKIKRVFKVIGKILSLFILVLLLGALVTEVSPVYDYPVPQPFNGPDIYNPYRNFDSTQNWKRANFHTHTRVDGLLNECEFNPGETLEFYDKLGYEIVTFSNHNEITPHPLDSTLFVSVYEHGYNILKFHKLVFGADHVDYFDNLLPIFPFQKQFVIDRLAKKSDFIQLNHPLRTGCFSKDELEKLEGFEIMELDSGKSTENEYWDWSLSAGHYSFGLANDDLHFPDLSYRIARRSNFIQTPSETYDDLKAILLEGNYYSMRTPDYGDGDWNIKYESNRNLPKIISIGLKPDEIIHIGFSEIADSIKFIGKDHKTLLLVKDAESAEYQMTDDDPYARIIAYFGRGEVIYTNPFARYDRSRMDSPFRSPAHRINIPLTVLYNFILMLLCMADLFAIYKIIKLKDK